MEAIHGELDKRELLTFFYLSAVSPDPAFLLLTQGALVEDVQVFIELAAVLGSCEDQVNMGAGEAETVAEGRAERW